MAMVGRSKQCGDLSTASPADHRDHPELKLRAIAAKVSTNVKAFSKMRNLWLNFARLARESTE